MLIHRGGGIVGLARRLVGRHSRHVHQLVRLRELRPGPGADVLVYDKKDGGGGSGGNGDAEKSNALILTQNAGAGRVYFSACDETWRWRFRTGEEHFARYWGQVIRWLASDRLPPGDGSARIGSGAPLLDGDEANNAPTSRIEPAIESMRVSHVAFFADIPTPLLDPTHRLRGVSPRAVCAAAP